MYTHFSVADELAKIDYTRKQKVRKLEESKVERNSQL